MDAGWLVVLDVVLLLAGATALGLACHRFGQNPILGYLLAGMLLGPDVLGLVRSAAALDKMAELGVALLLFTIGLEFSWTELRDLGHKRLVAGTLQVALTTALAATVAVLAGLSVRGAIAVGAIIALSSTACVLSVLQMRAEMDAYHARQAFAILLLQDLALVPMVVLIRALGGGASWLGVTKALAISVALATALVLVFRLVSKRVLEPLFRLTATADSREIAILLTFTTCLGSAWIAHALDLSPALGAFVAGMLLADSRFATRVRADVAALKTLFVALFFATVGLLAQPAWMFFHLVPLLALVVAIIVGKVLVVALIGRAQRESALHSIASGICLANVGEFSFVLIGVASAGHLLTQDAEWLLVGAAVLTLFATPYLVASSTHVSSWLVRRLRIAGPAAEIQRRRAEDVKADHVIVVGLGPAGLEIVHSLRRSGVPMLIVELNAAAARAAEREGVASVVGDAAHESVLRHLSVERARAIVVTVPDLRAASIIIANARSIAPHVPILARARHHVHAIHLLGAGALYVVDEERAAGERLGLLVREVLSEGHVTLGLEA